MALTQLPYGGTKFYEFLLLTKGEFRAENPLHNGRNPMATIRPPNPGANRRRERERAMSPPHRLHPSLPLRSHAWTRKQHWGEAYSVAGLRGQWPRSHMRGSGAVLLLNTVECRPPTQEQTHTHTNGTPQSRDVVRASDRTVSVQSGYCGRSWHWQGGVATSTVANAPPWLWMWYVSKDSPPNSHHRGS